MTVLNRKLHVIHDSDMAQCDHIYNIISRYRCTRVHYQQHTCVYICRNNHNTIF